MVMIVGWSCPGEIVTTVKGGPVSAKEAFEILDRNLGDRSSYEISLPWGGLAVEKSTSLFGDAAISVSTTGKYGYSLFRFEKDKHLLEDTAEFRAEVVSLSERVGLDLFFGSPWRTLPISSQMYSSSVSHADLERYAKLFDLQMDTYCDYPLRGFKGGMY